MLYMDLHVPSIQIHRGRNVHETRCGKYSPSPPLGNSRHRRDNSRLSDRGDGVGTRSVDIITEWISARICSISRGIEEDRAATGGRRHPVKCELDRTISEALARSDLCMGYILNPVGFLNEGVLISRHKGAGLCAGFLEAGR